jgi:8-oxo-dGTP diphosphatase
MIVIVCSVLITDGQRVLMVKEKKVKKYGLPGGKLESGETLHDCAIRETSEEIGAAVDLKSLVMVTEKPRTHEGNTVLRYIYKATIKGQESSSELEYSYFTPEEAQSLIDSDKIRGRDVVQLLEQFYKGNLKRIPEPTSFA